MKWKLPYNLFKYPPSFVKWPLCCLKWLSSLIFCLFIHFFLHFFGVFLSFYRTILLAKILAKFFVLLKLRYCKLVVLTIIGPTVKKIAQRDSRFSLTYGPNLYKFKFFDTVTFKTLTPILKSFWSNNFLDLIYFSYKTY